MKLHILITFFWVVFVASIAVCADWSGLGPNEIGDFLAGIAAPPAFYWLIVGYFLQQQELSLQRQEIARLAQAQEKQTSISDSLLNIENQKVSRKWLDDQIAQIPTKLKNLRDSISRMKNIESPNTKDTYPVAQPDAVSNKLFAKLFLKMVISWEREVGDKFGPIEECIEFTHDSLYYDLSHERLQLIEWQDKCFKVSRAIGSDIFFNELRESGLADLLWAIEDLQLEVI